MICKNENCKVSEKPPAFCPFHILHILLLLLLLSPSNMHINNAAACLSRLIEYLCVYIHTTMSAKKIINVSISTWHAKGKKIDSDACLAANKQENYFNKHWISIYDLLIFFYFTNFCCCLLCIENNTKKISAVKWPQNENVRQQRFPCDIFSLIIIIFFRFCAWSIFPPLDYAWVEWVVSVDDATNRVPCASTH